MVWEAYQANRNKCKNVFRICLGFLCLKFNVTCVGTPKDERGKNSWNITFSTFLSFYLFPQVWRSWSKRREETRRSYSQSFKFEARIYGYAPLLLTLRLPVWPGGSIIFQYLQHLKLDQYCHKFAKIGSAFCQVRNRQKFAKDLETFAKVFRPIWSHCNVYLPTFLSRTSHQFGNENLWRRN